MEIRKCLFYIGWMLLISCSTQVQLDQLPQGEIPYQRFVADENTEVLLYVYDDWGTQNNICVRINDTLYCSRFEVDPIPIVKMVRHDTIFLEYHNYISQGEGVVCKQSIYEWAQNVGPYTIVNCRYYDLKGSTIRQCIDVDSISMSETQMTLYKNGTTLRDISLNDIVFKKDGNGKYNICVSEIDTVDMIEKSCYYKVDGQLLTTLRNFQGGSQGRVP